jgi:hypothetical protein
MKLGNFGPIWSLKNQENKMYFMLSLVESQGGNFSRKAI